MGSPRLPDQAGRRGTDPRRLAGERLIQSNSKEVPPETPSLDRVEWEHIQRVLTDCDGNVSQAARWLGIDRRTLQRKLGKYPPIR